MAGNPATSDVTTDTSREGDQQTERMGDFDEKRCEAAPAEVRAQVDETLARAFPQPKS